MLERYIFTLPVLQFVLFTIIGCCYGNTGNQDSLQTKKSDGEIQYFSVWIIEDPILADDRDLSVQMENIRFLYLSEITITDSENHYVSYEIARCVDHVSAMNVASCLRRIGFGAEEVVCTTSNINVSDEIDSVVRKKTDIEELKQQIERLEEMQREDESAE